MVHFFCKVILLLCFPICAFGQVDKLHKRIEPYYDYFIFGVTDNNIKNIKELAKKYHLDGRHIFYNSKIHKHYSQDYNDIADYIKFNKGDTLVLPAFTLAPIRLDFDKYSKEIPVGKKDTLNLWNLTAKDTRRTALDSNAIKELNKVWRYHKKLTFFELPEVSCVLDSIIPLGKITITPTFKLYLVEAINFNSAYRNQYIYPVEDNRLTSLPIIVGFGSPQYWETIHSRMFYYNNQLVLLQTLINNRLEYWYRKVSIYTFESYYNDIWRFKEAENRCLYEVYESSDGDTELIQKLNITKKY